MDGQGSTDHARISRIPVRHRGRLPRTKALFGKPKYLAGHRDGKIIIDKVKNQRKLHFEGSSHAKNAAARRRISFSCSRSRIHFLASRNSTASPGLHPHGCRPEYLPFQPVVQRCFRSSKVLRDLGNRGFMFASNGNHITTSFYRERFRYHQYPSCNACILTSQATSKPRAVPVLFAINRSLKKPEKIEKVVVVYGDSYVMISP